ncbi:F-box/WD repeat-containing protein 11-like isoform X1 [Acanthaster planci]|uniref:F-box/WD repeat-containing protein 11-like isoform X1 n=1 Tax=Acanthaster planci TaxID=133434 RepID=A0A8B7Y4W5_ACAPL|nr:F-box/WD repeat-containing protein 11-like isoform X1 [Acanthaster planci]
MESSSLSGNLVALPTELHHVILQYLSARDLCHMALCNRSWRDVANQDALWRPLCRRRRWERFGTTEDLCKEVSTALPAGNTSVAFPIEMVVTDSDSSTLIQTCKWKEVYMRAQHLEANWINNCCHTVSFEFGAAGCHEYWENPAESELLDPNKTEGLVVAALDAEGACLAGSLSNNTLKIWDMSTGDCQHTITLDGFSSGSPNSLMVKSGIVAVGCWDGRVRTFSAQTGEKQRVLGNFYREVTHVLFDGEIIVSTAHPENDRYTYDDSGDEEESKGEDGDDDDGGDEEGGDSGADGSVGGDIRAYLTRWGEPRTSDMIEKVGNEIKVFGSEDTSNFRLRYGSGRSPLIHVDYRDKIVAAAYEAKIICLWDAQSGSRQHTINTGLNCLVSCHLGDGIVIGTNKTNEPVMKMWKLSSGQLIEAFDCPSVRFFDKANEISKVCGRMLYHFDPNNAFIVGRSKYGMLGMFGLDGSYYGDTKSFKVADDFEDHLRLIVPCLHGNKIIGGECCDGRMFLFILSSAGGFKLVREVRPMMQELFAGLDNVNPLHAWMSTTKLVFVSYFRYEEKEEIQVPKIVIHHYW